MVPGPRNVEKIKNDGFGPLGAGYLSKKAKQLSSRDQVGCSRSLPGFAGEPPSPAVRMPSRRPWAPLQIQGGCASSRLDHGLKVKLPKPMKCGFLAPSGAKNLHFQNFRIPKPVPNPSRTHPNPSKPFPNPSQTLSTIATPFSAICGPARGQIYGSKAENM